jgi:hypothetical protein
LKASGLNSRSTKAIYQDETLISCLYLKKANSQT